MGVHNRLGFGVGTSINLFFVRRPKLTFFLRAENDLFLVSVLTDLVFVWVVDIGFCMRAGNHLVLVRPSKMTWFVLVEIDLISVRWKRKLT